jgi:prepilin-type N-terminal cleavage/methylation domain-containing protein
MKNPGQPSHAFTLIEIMIVVGIIAIVVAMGMPSFVQMAKKDPLRKAVSDLVEGCNEARQRAILNAVPAELTIRASDGLLAVRQVATNQTAQVEGSGEGAEPAAASAAPNQTLFVAHLHEDIAVRLLYVNLKDQMEAEEARVRFYPNGTSDEFTIILEAKGEIRKISLECVTGLPDVEVIR